MAMKMFEDKQRKEGKIDRSPFLTYLQPLIREQQESLSPTVSPKSFSPALLAVRSIASQRPRVLTTSTARRRSTRPRRGPSSCTISTMATTTSTTRTSKSRMAICSRASAVTTLAATTMAATTMAVTTMAAIRRTKEDNDAVPVGHDEE